MHPKFKNSAKMKSALSKTNKKYNNGLNILDCFIENGDVSIFLDVLSMILNDYFRVENWQQLIDCNVIDEIELKRWMNRCGDKKLTVFQTFLMSLLNRAWNNSSFSIFSMMIGSGKKLDYIIMVK